MIDYTLHEKALMVLINHVASLNLIPALAVNTDGEQERVSQLPLDTPAAVNLWTKTLVNNNDESFGLLVATEISNQTYRINLTRDGLPISLTSMDANSPEVYYVFNATQDGEMVKEAALYLASGYDRLKQHMSRHVIKHTIQTQRTKKG